MKKTSSTSPNSCYTTFDAQYTKKNQDQNMHLNNLLNGFSERKYNPGKGNPGRLNNIRKDLTHGLIPRRPVMLVWKPPLDVEQIRNTFIQT